jgi:hypothetical protein
MKKRVGNLHKLPLSLANPIARILLRRKTCDES